MVIRGGETRAREIAAYQGTEPAVFADMMTHLFGKVQDVYCAMDTLDDRTVENVPVIGSGRVDVEDTWTATIRFKDGPVVTWAYSRETHGEPDRAGVYYGTEGTIVDPGNVMHPCVCCFESATIGEAVRFEEVLEGRVETYQNPINDHWGM